jgi:monothiol glutaredoxin
VYLNNLTYSSRDWPTIPQLYVNQEFIGGCDIVTNMFKEGELQKLLEDAKLISKE